MSESDFEKNIDDIMKISQDIINKQKEEARKLKEKEKEEARKLREKEEEEARKLREKEEEEARKQKIEREKKEQKEKEIKEWESGEAAKSVERYTELLAKGYKITASSCGGDTASLDVLKFAIEKGLKEEDINYLFTNTKNPERMEVLVKQGHADVNSYPIQNIKDWYEESYTTEKVYLGCRWETHYSGKYDKEWEECVKIYDYVKHYKNPEAIMAFQKLVELGYKPKNVEDAEAVVYMIEVSEKEKEQQAKMEAEKQAEIQRKAEEEQAKILREKEEKASDTLEIDKLPPALKLLGKTLLEKDLNRYVPRPKHDSDGNKTKCIFDYLTVRGYKKEESDKVWLYNVEEIATELVKLQKNGVISKKFEILKPEEFINSDIFTNPKEFGLSPDRQDFRETNTIKDYMTSVENKRREKLQELNNKKINQLRMRTAKKADKVAKKVGVNTNFEKALSERLERRAK